MDFPTFVHTLKCARVVHLGATQRWGTGQKLKLNNNLISTYVQSYNTPDSVSLETLGGFRPCLRIYFSSITSLQAVLCHADSSLQKHPMRIIARQMAHIWCGLNLHSNQNLQQFAGEPAVDSD